MTRLLRIPAPVLGLMLLLACMAGAQELIGDREGHRVTPGVVEPTLERLARLRVPEGFRVGVWADGLGSPRMMAAAPDGFVYVTRPSSGDVIGLRDTDGDGRAEARDTVVRNLPRVHGIALRDGAMYLATVDAVYRVLREEGSWGQPERLLHGLPPGGRHPNRTLGFSPDGHLFVSVGSTCNACIEESRESAAMLRVSKDLKTREVYARGLRNTIGFDWHPQTGELWGLDHGTDWLGDRVPPEELNHIRQGDYGWPFLYGDGLTPQPIIYPKGFDVSRHRQTAISSVLEYDAHAAPIQMAFYTRDAFPAPYRADAFAAMHGSWNREPPSGYEVVRIDFEGGRPRTIEPFVRGFLADDGETTFGRPAGLTIGADGSVLFGDDANGVIYRVTSTAR